MFPPHRHSKRQWLKERPGTDRERLVVSAATSKTYVSRLLAKLHARDRAQLVAIAYETGLVTPGAG